MRNLIIISFFLPICGCVSTKKCEKAICTEMFAMVNVELKDSTNQTLSGISTQTVLLSSGKVIHAQSDPGSFTMNSFILVDDSDLKEIGFETSQKVEFHIIKAGNIIKKVSFIIKADCCHVSKADGPELVSLN